MSVINNLFPPPDIDETEYQFWKEQGYKYYGNLPNKPSAVLFQKTVEKTEKRQAFINTFRYGKFEGRPYETIEIEVSLSLEDYSINFCIYGFKNVEWAKDNLALIESKCLKIINEFNEQIKKSDRLL